MILMFTKRYTTERLCLLFAFIELKRDTGVQGDEDKSSSDEATPHVSSNNTATPNVAQDASQNTTMALMHSCPQDTKL